MWHILLTEVQGQLREINPVCTPYAVAKHMSICIETNGQINPPCINSSDEVIH
jgi:hypothetical protein